MLGKLKDSYESALLESSSTLTTVESTLRQLTWFLPGRFEDAEIASEGLYSALSIVGIYHDSLIAKRLDQISTLPPSPFPAVHTYTSSTPIAGPASNTPPISLDPSAKKTAERWSERQTIPPPSDHSRYTRHYCQSSPAYNRASRTLVFIQYVQLLVEMIVRKRNGDKRRWTVLLWLEGIKSTLRLILLGVTRRPLLSSPIPGREIDPSLLPSSTPPAEPAMALELEDSLPDLPHIPALPPAPLHSHVLPSNEALPSSLQPSALHLLPRLKGTREWLGEGMQATEGLVCILSYLLVARRQHRRAISSPNGPGVISWNLSSLAQNSTLPSLLPLLWILVARSLRRNPKRGDEGVTPLLADTYTERDSAMIWNLVRGSIWQRYTRPKAERVLNALEGVWGVRLVAGLVRDHVGLVDELYYYTAS